MKNKNARSESSKNIKKAVIITWIYVLVVIVTTTYASIEKRAFSALYFGLIILVSIIFVIGYFAYRFLNKKKGKR